MEIKKVGKHSALYVSWYAYKNKRHSDGRLGLYNPNMVIKLCPFGHIIGNGP